ncbi:MAG: hypothetical protein AAF985_14550 [Bacteroidota bacterium]
MKFHNKLTLLNLFFVTQLFASSGAPKWGVEPIKTSSEAVVSFSKIFYSDYENTTLFVDFNSLGNQFSELNILRDNRLMMTDDIRDLDINTIYEINLEVFREGTYILELKTPDGIKVHKEFVIN